MGEVRSKITEELFAMMDMDGNARLDFDEYVAVALSRTACIPKMIY